MSLNNNPAKTLDRNSKSEINKHKTELVFTPFECINFSKFDEMRKKLDFFYYELSNSLNDKTNIDNENVKKGFFNSLEILLIEISLIKDEKLRITKIDEVFKWFKKKVSSFQKINMDFKSSKKHFEKYPILDNYKKSETFELIKVFEKENETIIEERVNNAKERLKKFKTKKILPVKIKILDDKQDKVYKNFKSNEISFQIEAEDSLYSKKQFTISFKTNNRNQINSSLKNVQDNRQASAASSNYFRSTINTSNHKDFNFPYNFSSSNTLKISVDSLNQNVSLLDQIKYSSNDQLNILVFDPASNIDLSPSNSPFRPKYEYTNYMEISEKRNYEEMKEYLKEWAKNKVSFKEGLEKKYDLKKLINNYEKSFNQKKEENQSEVFNLENLNLKKTMSPSPIKIKRDKTFFDNSINKKNILEIKSTDNFTINSNEKSIAVLKEDPNLILKNKIRNANKIFNNLNRLNFNKVKYLDNNEQMEGKEDNKSPNKLSPNQQFKQNLIKINIRFNEIEMVKKHLDIIPELKKSFDRFPKEASFLLKTYDKIFESRQNFSKLLQVNEIDDDKNEYRYNENPLSLNDCDNINATPISPNGAFNSNSYATGFDFTYKNSDNCVSENFNFNSFSNSKNNFLFQRRTVSFNNRGFSNNNSHLLTQKQKFRKNNFNFSHDAIRKAFLPPADDKKYPKYFLPQPGFGLLTRTNIKIEKKD